MTNILSLLCRRVAVCCIGGIVSMCVASVSLAQSVCLPAPRLLTTMPMGGRAGSEIEITITGEHIEDVSELRFSSPGITAAPKLDDSGQPQPNTFVVTIAADTPADVYEARLMSRLGLSSARVFSVGKLPEALREKANTSLDTAMELKVNSICNAAMTSRAVDHYSFEPRKGQRVVVNCAAKGIDSKLNPVLIICDAKGRDLLVERRGGALDFTVPEDGKYVIKVHDLTFQGGPAYFYRLALREVPADAPVPRLPSTKTVSSFSWPPVGLSPDAASSEHEPNNKSTESQQISLPCDIAGSFFPAADVDTFEFTAKKGEVWWVEVASERLGLPTDPSILVQHVSGEGSAEKLTDVAELSDIPSPMKPSTNHYSYNGPPYDGGSSDILAKLKIKEDGLHRLQLRDLFGGTRDDPRNVYRLIIRKAAPDFALVAWALHMELRNGDRNALSKPITLRGGSTLALEVVVVRRDGFDGDIELGMDRLPEGVSATGLKIPAGKSRGIMLITAQQDAPRGLTSAKFFGRAEVNGESVTRPCRLASMAWPVRDGWREIPSPRLLADVPVSVSGSEFAPLTIAPVEDKVWEAKAGENLTIPLVHTRRCEFSGATIELKTIGEGFEQMPRFEVPLTADHSQAVLDLAALKTPPGDYLIAFCGSAVAKYRYNLEAVKVAEVQHTRAAQEAKALAAEAKRLAEEAKTALADKKAEADKVAATAVARQKAAAVAAEAAAKRLKAAIDQAQPKDISDIILSEPIAIRVKPGETK